MKKTLNQHEIMKKIFLSLVVIMFLIGCQSDELDSSLEDNIQNIEKLKTELDIDLTIDDSATPENSLVFDNVEEMKSFILNFRKPFTDMSSFDEQAVLEEQPSSKDNLSGSERDPCDGLSGYFNASYSNFYSLGTATMNLHVSVSNGQITGVNTGISGITVSLDYNQNYYHQTRGSYSVNGLVSGTMSVSLISGGVGTIYRERVNFRMSIPCGGTGAGAPSGGRLKVYMAPVVTQK